MMEAAVFDVYAEGYDEAEARNPIKKRLRRRSLAALRGAFPQPCRLLDIGAGTGTEAVTLAREGHEMVALDPSRRMLDRLAGKAEATGVAIATHTAKARDLADMVEVYGELSFDGAYASFGALNIEPDLSAVAAPLHRLVRPGGRFVTSTMTRFPVVEVLGNAVMLRPRRAVRRMMGRASFRPDGGAAEVDVHYPSLSGLRRSFGPGFSVESAAALNLLVPGPSAWQHMQRVPDILRSASWCDDRIAAWPGLRALGDHALVVFRREG